MALPDDGASKQTDFVQEAYAISKLIGPALKAASVGMGLVYAETCSPNSNVIRFRKSGSLIAEAVTEAAVYTPSDANSDITDTYVDATAVKVAVGSPITVEALRFAGGSANFGRFGDEQGRALARAFDTELLALVNGTTATATATSTMSKDCLLEGVYNIHKGLIPPGPLVALLDFKGRFELAKEAGSAGAAVFTNQMSLPLLSGVPAQNGFMGNYLGVDIYQTTGFSTTGGDNQQVIFDPRYAFAAALGGSVETQIRWTCHGLASQVAGFAYEVSSWVFWDVIQFYDAAACELRSDT